MPFSAVVLLCLCLMWLSFACRACESAPAASEGRTIRITVERPTSLALLPGNYADVLAGFQRKFANAIIAMRWASVRIIRQGGRIVSQHMPEHLHCDFDDDRAMMYNGRRESIKVHSEGREYQLEVRISRSGKGLFTAS